MSCRREFLGRNKLSRRPFVIFRQLLSRSGAAGVLVSLMNGEYPEMMGGGGVEPLRLMGRQAGEAAVINKQFYFTTKCRKMQILRREKGNDVQSDREG